MQKKTLLTGIKPTDHAHLGNYLGAIRPGLELSSQYERSFLFIADYHAVTTVQNPKELRDFTLSLAATWIACGLDPKKTVIYRQSDVPEIFELSWLLSCVAPKGLLDRAHAYKANVQENTEAGRDADFGVSMGLYTYPVLMAADILAFNTDTVPVGSDQVQHVEIARDIAQKINRTFGDGLLHLPQALVKTEKVIPGLDGRKMSKSYGNHIPMFIDSKALRKFVMKIKTDSLPPEAPKDPKESAIFDLYKEFATPEEIEALRAQYASGIGWGHAKEALYQVIDRTIAPIRDRYNQLMASPAELDEILLNGAARAREVAGPLMKKIRVAIRGA